MIRFRSLLFVTAMLLSPGLLVTPGYAAETPSQTPAKGLWQKVDSKRVCMVTNMVFPRDQIPVQVGKKTYYGCCENCKATLGNDEASRFAIDPVSRKKVDKALASIAAGPDGEVEYFENDANLQKFIALRSKT